MNKKLSGAQLVLVPITRVGVNRLPFVENIAKRYVKFIDFVATDYLPDTTARGIMSSTGMFITIADMYGNTKLMDNLPMSRLDYANINAGVRQAIGAKISMQDCFITNMSASNVGKMCALMMYYDLEEFSRRNMSDKTIVDFVTVPIVTCQRYNKFPDSDRMAGKRFRRILLDTYNTIAPDFNQLVNQAYLNSVFVTLRKGSYNVVENMPIKLLQQYAFLEKTEWANIIFDFNSSYITIGGAGTITGQNNYLDHSIMFNIEYEA